MLPFLFNHCISLPNHYIRVRVPNIYQVQLPKTTKKKNKKQLVRTPRGCITHMSCNLPGVRTMIFNMENNICFYIKYVDSVSTDRLADKSSNFISGRLTIVPTRRKIDHIPTNICYNRARGTWNYSQVRSTTTDRHYLHKHCYKSTSSTLIVDR